jgi:hypothetical protein
MQKLVFFLIGSMTVPLIAQNSYYRHNLVSDLPGTADHTDPNLVNPWGNAFGASTPFWIANEGTGTSTLYDGVGDMIPLVVKIPAAGGASTAGKVPSKSAAIQLFLSSARKMAQFPGGIHRRIRRTRR